MNSDPRIPRNASQPLALPEDGTPKSALRKQLLMPGWMKIVSNEEKGQGGNWELQEIYLFQPGGKINGIVIISAEPGELSVVNIVGPIDFEKLRNLDGIFGIPRIPVAGLRSN